MKRTFPADIGQSSRRGAAVANGRHSNLSLLLPRGWLATMIDVIALVHGLTVVTHNRGNFGRVPALQVEDWLA